MLSEKERYLCQPVKDGLLQFLGDEADNLGARALQRRYLLAGHHLEGLARREQADPDAFRGKEGTRGVTVFFVRPLFQVQWLECTRFVAEKLCQFWACKKH